MERRVLGIATLVATLLLAVSLSNLIAAPVTGAPVTAAIPGPPAVGDCLVERPPLPNQSIGQGGPPPRPLSFGSCDAPHFGEAFHVVLDIEALDEHEEMEPCWAEDYWFEYLFGGDDTDLSVGVWWPAATPWESQSGPTAYQRAAGQRWLACWAVVPGKQGLPYEGSIRGAVGTVDMPPEFGLCVDDLADPYGSQQQRTCRDPHRYEILAYAGFDDPGITEERLDDTCRQIAAQLTGMPDTTAGGALLVDAQAYRIDQNGVRTPGLGALDQNEYGEAVCAASAVDGRLLGGSLLGLGAAAVPWA